MSGIKEDFKDFVKEQFDFEISYNLDAESDTFESLFGISFGD